MGHVAAKVHVVPDVAEAVNNTADTHHIYGMVRMKGKDAQIYIEDGDERWRAQVLFHELAHLAKHLAALEKPVRSEEAIVGALETHLFPILWEQGWRPRV